MTLQEINSKYSYAELQSLPGEVRRELYTPFLTDLYENKVIYYERFLCVAILKNIKTDTEKFEATAIPYINIQHPEREGRPFPKKPWTFGVGWPYIRMLGDHFGGYSSWLIWTDKELVKTVEELAKRKEFEAAYDLTAYKGYNKE